MTRDDFRFFHPFRVRYSEIDGQSVRITLKQPAKGKEGEDPLASFARAPVSTSEFYPDFERFVLYDRLPFIKLPTDE